jgi:hypothetical protein
VTEVVWAEGPIGASHGEWYNNYTHDDLNGEIEVCKIAVAGESQLGEVANRVAQRSGAWGWRDTLHPGEL